MDSTFDLREAINAISDVVQNRPRPLREFDQIYMKAGDMVAQSEFVAQWADKKNLVFLGDGDSISVCVAYLRRRGIIDYGPSAIRVYDFDERIVSAIKRFADKEGLDDLDAELYNCLDAWPGTGEFQAFYTNPPWGASNQGESVRLFVQRGFEATAYRGEGLVVIADDEDLPWTKEVLHRTQRFAASSEYFVSRMMPRLHSYHLDDNPELRSCNLLLRSLSDAPKPVVSEAVRGPESLDHFYGLNQQPRVQYVRERKRVDYGKAHESEYELELLEGSTS